MAEKEFVFVNKKKFDKLKTDVGVLSELETDEKSNIVRAINEAASTGGGYLYGGKDLPSSITKTADSLAQFDVIKATTENTDKEIFSFDVDKAIFGKYSIIIRAKTSAVASSSNILKLETYYHNTANDTYTLLDTCLIKESSFGTANVYKTLGFNTNYQGTDKNNNKLRIVGTVLGNGTRTMISVDYLIVSYAYTAIVSQ